MLLLQVPEHRLSSPQSSLEFNFKGLPVELLRDINVNDKIILPIRVRTLSIQTVFNMNKTIWPKSDVN